MSGLVQYINMFIIVYIGIQVFATVNAVPVI